MVRARRLTPATGDINGDGHVNALDLSILPSHWHSAARIR